MPWFGKGRRDAPSAWAAALKEVLKATDPTVDVAEFVLGGQHAEALKNVKSGRPWIHGLGYGDSGVVNKAMATLYAGFGEVDAAVLRRWGRVLDLLWGTQTWGLTLGDVGGCHWPELMLRQAAVAAPSGPLPFTFADLERIAAEDGAAAADLVRMAFTLAKYSRYQGRSARDVRGSLSRLPGFADAVVAHRDVSAVALASGSVDQRVVAVSLLGMLGDTVLGALAEPLAGAATSTSGQVRDAVRPLITRIDEAAVDPLRRLAADGTPERRAYALELLAARPDQRDWALKTAGADRAASVRALSARWETAGTVAETGEEVLPELPPLPSWSLPAADAERVADQVVEGVKQGIASHNRRMEALRQRHPAHAGGRWISVPPSGTVARLADLLAADRPVPADARLAGLPAPHLFASQVADVIQRYGYPAATAIQVTAALGWLDPSKAGYAPWREVINEVHARVGGPDLLTVQRMLDAAGADGRALVWSAYSAKWGSRIGRDWPDDHVQPFVAHNLDWIMEESSSRQDWHTDEHALFAAIATLPKPPARLVDRLYSLALGTRKSDRVAAQEALRHDPRRTLRAATALQDGKGDVRLAAAQWLTRIADPSALPPLRAAWQKEKQDVVRGALLDALTAIGEDAATYLDPARTVAAAEKFVAAGVPSSLAWLDWTALPELTWTSGETVPASVVQWLCGTAVKAKSPEPDAVLRHYAALFDAAARERLAAHLLAGWLREDLRPVPLAQAQARAAKVAVSHHRWYSAQNGPYAGMSVEQVEAALAAGYAKEPVGSATDSKGLLAVVAACGGRDVVPPAERYLREWYGQRAAQGKALIAMLAWVEHPSATQLVLAIGSRFRTKSFQEEAVRQVGALAERKGWTVDELADRTVPTGGFDAEGVLELPYGPRTFTAVLRPDLTVELRDPDGKTIKALPAPRQSDDAERAKESKKAYAAAKKDLKSIATLQAQRLYEAMCTERSWPAEDWDRYLLRHPVAGPAVRRLVWVATAADGAALTFRPLDDGSLTDMDDNDVELPDGARVMVAHDSVLSTGEVAQWTAHLADYEVTPLFQQLGRGVLAITPQMRSKRELTDFTGYLLEAFALRGRAGRLGYTRGQSEDAGWFYTYDKRFPTLGIVATVSFTGNPLPEENRLVALKELSFRREAPDGRRAELTLGDVPAVLASECWQDMRLLAAEGTGYDPDWEKKSEY